MNSDSVLINLDLFESDLVKFTKYAEFLFSNKHLMSEQNYIKELTDLSNKLDRFFSIEEESNILDLIEISGGLNDYLIKQDNEELFIQKDELINRAEEKAESQGLKGYGKIGTFIRYKHNSYYNIIKLYINSMYLDKEFIESLKIN